jgi:putative transposase
MHVMLAREGWDINMKQTDRIYRELGLQPRNRTPKRRVSSRRALTVVDTFSRYVPVFDPRFRYRAKDVVRAPEQVCPAICYPKTIRVDQGSKFVSRDLDLWAYANGVTLDFSRPGKPTDNAYIEAVNGRFRAECLNAHWFLTLADAA